MNITLKKSGVLFSTLLLIGILSACGRTRVVEQASGAPAGGIESAPLADLDADGVTDATDNCMTVANVDQSDMDDDRTGDACDHDIDGDGVRNELDLYPNDTAKWTDPEPDAMDVDEDGVADLEDLCPEDADPDQSDLDDDGLGDACDNDADGDGFNALADCDDSHKGIHPGVLDPIDPDHQDQDCDGVDGIRDAFWVATDGDDANPGTIDQPFLTIQKGVDEAIAANGEKPVKVVEGVYPEDISLGGTVPYVGIHLLGGFGPLNSDGTSRNRDRYQHVTQFSSIAIDGRSGEPVNGHDTTVDGFHISKTAIVNASPTFHENSLFLDVTCEGGIALTIDTFGSRMFSPMFSQNVIENEGCIFNIDLVFAIIAVNIQSHDASQLQATFIQNFIAALSGLPPADFVIALRAEEKDDSNLDVNLDSNEIKADAANAYSAAVNMWSSSLTGGASVSAQHNDVQADFAPLSRGFDLGTNGMAGGPELFGMANLQRNTILGGQASESSAGVAIVNSTRQSSLVNNFIHAGRESATAEGVSLYNANADILNNTLVAGTTDGSSLIALLRENGLTTIENNVFFGNDAVDIGVNAAGDVPPVTLTGNLFDPTIDILYTSPSTGDLVTLLDLTTAFPAFTPNFVGSALLVDPVNLNFHLQAGSAAIDAVANGPERDIDGDNRPIGADFDIGADEAF